MLPAPNFESSDGTAVVMFNSSPCCCALNNIMHSYCIKGSNNTKDFQWKCLEKVAMSNPWMNKLSGVEFKDRRTIAGQGLQLFCKFCCSPHLFKRNELWIFTNLQSSIAWFVFSKLSVLVKIRENSKFVILVGMWWLQRQERGIGEKRQLFQ